MTIDNTNLHEYHSSFTECLKGFQDIKPVFSCNCILNYLYGKLDGKATPPFAGPVTFGEVAYQLLNQTLVYAEIIDKMKSYFNMDKHSHPLSGRA